MSKKFAFFKYSLKKYLGRAFAMNNFSGLNSNIFKLNSKFK